MLTEVIGQTIVLLLLEGFVVPARSLVLDAVSEGAKQIVDEDGIV